MSKKSIYVLAFVMAVSVPAMANLIVNGDFEAGNAGFSTEYSYTDSGSCPFQYSIKTDPQLWASGYASIEDHTSGDGNMLLIDASGNASGGAGRICWTETVTVAANTDYAFSTWVAQIYPGGLTSTIEFLINNTVVGTYTTFKNDTAWRLFATVWNSGSATSATLAIRETTGNNGSPGNDFAMDDIFFMPEPVTMLLLGLGGVLLRR